MLNKSLPKRRCVRGFVHCSHVLYSLLGMRAVLAFGIDWRATQNRRQKVLNSRAFCLCGGA